MSSSATLQQLLYFHTMGCPLSTTREREKKKYWNLAFRYYEELWRILPQLVSVVVSQLGLTSFQTTQSRSIIFDFYLSLTCPRLPSMSNLFCPKSWSPLPMSCMFSISASSRSSSITRGNERLRNLEHKELHIIEWQNYLHRKIILNLFICIANYQWINTKLT